MAFHLPGVACPVTIAGNNVTFVAWDVFWKRYSDCTLLGAWYVYNITRSASSAISAKSGTEDGGYTFTVADASAWSTGDKCVVIDSATITVRATLAATKAAMAHADTVIMAYSSTTYCANWNEAFLQTTTPAHVYGHISRQRCSFGGLTALGDQSANGTQVVWENVTQDYYSFRGFHYLDSGGGLTGGGVHVRYCRVKGCNIGIYFQGAGDDVCKAEFVEITGCDSGTYLNFNSTQRARFNHITVRGSQGYFNNNKYGIYQNCVSLEAPDTDFAGKNNAIYTSCASGDDTGTGGLTGITLVAAKYWSDNDNGHYIVTGHILTTSSLFNAGTKIVGIDYDIDGNLITDGVNVPVGCHVGTVTPYGITHPTASNVLTGTGTYVAWDGTQTPSLSPDFPDVGNVRDTDTVNGSAGTLDSDKILKSNATGSGAGNYNADNLSQETVKAGVDFGLPPLAGAFYGPAAADVRLGVDTRFMEVGELVVKDLTYAEEATRNTDPGEVYVLRQADGGPASYEHLGATKTPSLSPDYPEVENVTDDDTVNGSAGTLDLPALNKVAPSDTLRTVAGTMDIPAITKVAPSDTLEGVTGTMDIPSISSVIEADTLETVAGTYHEATEAEVQLAVVFGPNSTYTGTLSAPTEPTAITGTQTATTIPTTITSDALAVNSIYYALEGASSWSLFGTTRTGSGVLTLTGLVAGKKYWYFICSTQGGSSDSVVYGLVQLPATDGTTPVFTLVTATQPSYTEV